MLATINSFLYIVTITVGMLMIEKYVLLEPTQERKKQRIFYLICSVIIIAAFCLFGDRADIVVIVLAGLNIFLGRRRHRLLGLLPVIPLLGIMNGIAAPVFIVRSLIGRYGSETASRIGELSVYIVMSAAFVLFCIKGAAWRKWFDENMKDRRLSVGEYSLVCASGIIIMVFSNFINALMNRIAEQTPGAAGTADLIADFYLATSFVLTLTLVVMIMQGNKRKFYHDKVSAMQFNIIATMADIVENRDENTGGHIKRTAKYVEIIGRKLRADGKFPEILTEQYLSDMIVAAPLHDIGKIHIPDSILNKPARLTDEEFEIMRTHTTAGNDVLLKARSQLGEFEYLNIAAEMAEYHHEWWNGKGYPTAIAGEEIPLCARIMAVADVFDALTAKRCYKAAMPVEKAFSIIEEETGTHFDPCVVEAFFASRNKIEEAFEGGQN